MRRWALFTDRFALGHASASARIRRRAGQYPTSTSTGSRSSRTTSWSCGNLSRAARRARTPPVCCRRVLSPRPIDPPDAHYPRPGGAAREEPALVSDHSVGVQVRRPRTTPLPLPFIEEALTRRGRAVRVQDRLAADLVENVSSHVAFAQSTMPEHQFMECSLPGTSRPSARRQQRLRSAQPRPTRRRMTPPGKARRQFHRGPQPARRAVARPHDHPVRRCGTPSPPAARASASRRSSSG